MKKLTIVLGMFGMFALGCAAASVLVDQASAAPGSHECMSFGIPHISAHDLARGKVDKPGNFLPPGWTPVGGGGDVTAVVACRPVP